MEPPNWIRVGVDLYFLDHVNGRPHHEGELLALVIVHSIDHLVIEGFILTVGN
jgi:hypothetical protein